MWERLLSSHIINQVGCLNVARGDTRYSPCARATRTRDGTIASGARPPRVTPTPACRRAQLKDHRGDRWALNTTSNPPRIASSSFSISAPSDRSPRRRGTNARTLLTASSIGRPLARGWRHSSASARRLSIGPVVARTPGTRPRSECTGTKIGESPCPRRCSM